MHACMQTHKVVVYYINKLLFVFVALACGSDDLMTCESVVCLGH